MMQDTDNMDASCVFYVKVGMLYYLAHSQIWLVTVNQMGIVRLTAQNDLIVGVSFMEYPGDVLRQTSADILSLEECPSDFGQSCDFGPCTPQCILGNKDTMSNQLSVNCGMVGIPCNMQPYAAGFSLSKMYNLALTYAIVT